MTDNCWLALNRIPGLGGRGRRLLLERWGHAGGAFAAGPGAWRGAGLKETAIDALGRGPDALLTDADRRWQQSPGASLCRWTDDDYPPLLRQLPDPPVLLYLRGDRTLLNRPMLAIVGSRSPTPLGAETAKAFARNLGQAGLVIVSGLAAGIDATAHQGALETGTVAVMGTGPDRIYPRANLPLAQAIAARGLLVTEYPPGTTPRAGQFPQRNRLISGLSLGVLVVEAGEASGSLITARLAMEQGREVFAIPSSIHSPLSRGPHRLIREGAKLVETANHVLEELGPLHGFLQAAQEGPSPPGRDDPPRDADSRRVWSALDFTPQPPDIIAKRSGLTIEQVSAILLTLELEGRAAVSAGGAYCRLPTGGTGFG